MHELYRFIEPTLAEGASKDHETKDSLTLLQIYQTINMLVSKKLVHQYHFLLEQT